MDFTKITDSDLEIICGRLMLMSGSPYRILKNLDAKGAKRLKKNISKYGSDAVAELSDECRQYFAPDCDPMLTAEFFKGCEDEIALRSERKRSGFFAEYSDLPSLTVEALWQLTEGGWVDFESKGEYSEAALFEGELYRFCLRVRDFDVSAQLDREASFIEPLRLERDGDRFSLHCKYTSYETDEEGDVCFRFSCPEAIAEAYNQYEMIGYPWESLSEVATAIVNKSELSEKLCNSAEKELLPLMRELASVDGISDGKRDFTLLKQLAGAYGFDKVTSVLEQAEKHDEYSYKESQKRLALLNRAEYEPLWREIYEKIANSQKDYPRLAVPDAQKEALERARREIEVRLIADGYKGSYPDFYKDGSMLGVHLAESYEMQYFVGLKRRVRYFIRCTESTCDDGFYITFTSGTDLTKGGKCRDIYSCMFADDGKRLYRTTTYSPEADELAVSVSVAVKRAECKRLNRREKKQELGSPLFGVIWFILCLFITGGAFSILFHLLFIPLMWGLMWLFGEGESLGEFLRAVPWLHSVLFAWLGFGGLFGLTVVLAKRK